MNEWIEVMIEKPGLQTSIVDLGDAGMMHMGVPFGGALDRMSAQKANLIVGNAAGEDLLEICMFGPQILFQTSCEVAICGADISPSVGGIGIPLNKKIQIEAGTRLHFGRLVKGCRAYLAIRGKWLTKARKNGLAQPQLKKGDRIRLKGPKDTSPDVDVAGFLYPAGNPLSLYPGPEFHLFDRTYLAYFFSKEWTISKQSNRMGYRLEADDIPEAGIKEIISSPMLPGTIQITGTGQPVVLLADAQTTGGYPRLGIVPNDQLDFFGQKKPGDRIRFEFCALPGT